MSAPTLEDLAVRVAQLEERQGLATRADLLEVEVNIRRDIAGITSGVGADLRAIRQDLDGMRGDLAEIKRLLARGGFRWPWERR